MRKKAEEKAPRRKYFIAASCESARRRRAVAHRTYSGSESTSKAMKSVSRSPADVKASMPPTAKRASGKTSVCSRPAAVASRSSREPGCVAAEAAKEPSRETVRSAITKSATSAQTRMTVWKTSAGASSTKVPISGGVPLPAALETSEDEPPATATKRGPAPRTWTRRHTTAPSAPATAAKDRTICTPRRADRGRKASNRTPTTAEPRTTRSGVRAAHAIAGVVTSCSLRHRRSSPGCCAPP